MPTANRLPVRVPYHPARTDPNYARFLYAELLRWGPAKRTWAIGYKSRVTAGRPDAVTVYEQPVVVVHRHGRRVVTSFENDAGVTRPLGGGLLTLFPAGAELAPEYLEPCQGLVVAFDPSLLAEVAREVGTAAAFPTKVGFADDVLDGLCEAVWRAADRGPHLLDSLGRAVVTHVLERYAERAPAEPGWYRRAVAAADANLAGPVGVDDLATAAGMSRAHFSRLFAARAGAPPHAWLLARRVAKAQEIIRADPGRPLAEVAANAGFYDQSHLTAHFRKATGQTPAAFRKQVPHDPPNG